MVKYNIAIIGAGKFGTAIANNLAKNIKNNISIFSKSESKVQEINLFNKNSLVFPNTVLSSAISCTNDFSELKNYSFIFLAIPSYQIRSFINENKKFISKKTIVVNLAKGLISSKETITDFLEKEIPHCFISSMKGPSFAVELLNGSDTLFTFASKNSFCFKQISLISVGTNLFFDFSKDIKSVEYLSVFKNIYAILIGYIDAKYNSANTRFIILTKAFNEIQILLKEFDCNKETINLGCGFGDLCLTSLNDLSRNRTFGLLMGKGFYHANTNIVLEGKKAVELISSSINLDDDKHLPLLIRIINSFETGEIDIKFNEFMTQSKKTVITYGTFDMLHYGHLEILSKAKSIGTELIVGLSSDEFNKIKGKTCFHTYEKRKSLLDSLNYVDTVFKEEDWDQKINDVIKYDVDLFVIGDDWKGQFDFLKKYCEVIYLPRTPGISTTDLKKIIS